MSSPYIIAELSGNHNGDITRALSLIEAAKQAGADAVKLQTYTRDTLTINHSSSDFTITDGLWQGHTLYELYHIAHTPWEWHASLFEKGKSLGITVFSTPFDESAVDYLERLDAPLYKIASFELVHHPLIAYVAQTKKPLILSTGMASLSEINEAVEVAYAHGCQDLTLLHCVSAYPTSLEDCHLATIVHLKEHFPQAKIGFSDHTLGYTAAITAVALGAEVIEKHCTLARKEGGVDAPFSLEPHELHQLCVETRNAAKAIGAIRHTPLASEKPNQRFRRSIYVVQDIPEGALFTPENIRVIRPGFGLHPKHYHSLLGQKSPSCFKTGDRIPESLITG